MFVASVSCYLSLYPGFETGQGLAFCFVGFFLPAPHGSTAPWQWIMCNLRRTPSQNSSWSNASMFELIYNKTLPLSPGREKALWMEIISLCFVIIPGLISSIVALRPRLHIYVFIGTVSFLTQFQIIYKHTQTITNTDLVLISLENIHNVFDIHVMITCKRYQVTIDQLVIQGLHAAMSFYSLLRLG